MSDEFTISNVFQGKEYIFQFLDSCNLVEKPQCPVVWDQPILSSLRGNRPVNMLSIIYPDKLAKHQLVSLSRSELVISLSTNGMVWLLSFSEIILGVLQEIGTWKTAGGHIQTQDVAFYMPYLPQIVPSIAYWCFFGGEKAGQTSSAENLTAIDNS